MYGYSAAEAQHMNYEVLVPEEERARFCGRLAAIARGEKVESLEVRRRTKNGGMLDVWLTFTKLADDRGRSTGVATTERDITDRKQSEKELKAALGRLEEADRRKSAMFHELLEVAPDAMLIAGSDGTIKFVNSQLLRMFGYEREELLGKPVETLVPDRFRDLHLQHREHFAVEPRSGTSHRGSSSRCGCASNCKRRSCC
jgi:protein-histidine pros-kinase